MNLETITAPFGELPRETQLALFAAWLDGRALEFSPPGCQHWSEVKKPGWIHDCAYRLLPKPLTKPSINWDHVAPQWVAMARDEDGAMYFYSTRHMQAGPSHWIGSIDTDWTTAKDFASMDPGTCDWKDSLVLRPVAK